MDALLDMKISSRKSISLFTASLMGAVVLSSISTQPVSAREIQIPSRYRGDMCISSRKSSGTVKIRWGEWNTSFNASDVNEKGTDGLQAASAGTMVLLTQDSPLAMAGDLVLGGLFKYIHGVNTRISGYEIQISARGNNVDRLYISDNGARVYTRSCAFHRLAPSL
jgi:hypothetical protein